MQRVRWDSDDEDILLREGGQKGGRKWHDIREEYFPERTVEAVVSKYNELRNPRRGRVNRRRASSRPVINHTRRDGNSPDGSHTSSSRHDGDDSQATPDDGDGHADLLQSYTARSHNRTKAHAAHSDDNGNQAQSYVQTEAGRSVLRDTHSQSTLAIQTPTPIASPSPEHPNLTQTSDEYQASISMLPPGATNSQQSNPESSSAPTITVSSATRAFDPPRSAPPRSSTSRPDTQRDHTVAGPSTRPSRSPAASGTVEEAVFEVFRRMKQEREMEAAQFARLEATVSRNYAKQEATHAELAALKRNLGVVARCKCVVMTDSQSS